MLCSLYDRELRNRGRRRYSLKVYSQIFYDGYSLVGITDNSSGPIYFIIRMTV